MHGAASYLRYHQKGFGAVGVSQRYGERCFARYPISWGLKTIQGLPNPDPSDTSDWKPGEASRNANVVPTSKLDRGQYKRKAQKWAQLTEDFQADLFVFIGRWSIQKGIDLVANIIPRLLEEHPRVQLICVGPVIDLYGSFAAIKLGVTREKFPGRVFLRTDFTTVPPCVSLGAELALIPSRDDPFGLTAVGPSSYVLSIIHIALGFPISIIYSSSKFYSSN